MLSDLRAGCSYVSADLLCFCVKPVGGRDVRRGGGIFQKVGNDSGADLAKWHWSAVSFAFLNSRTGE